MPQRRSVSTNAVRLNALTKEIIRIEEQANQLHAQGRKALFLASCDSNNAMSFITGNEVGSVLRNEFHLRRAAAQDP
jgi:uncharacterized protein